MTHNPALDAVRGIAILIVVLGHAANDAMLPSWLGQGSGQMGVALFFGLSGYLIFALYGTQAPSSSDRMTYVVARAGRILPLYGLVIALSAVAATLGFQPYYPVLDPGWFWPSVLMVQAPQELWSVPVEVQFYALFLVAWPLLAAASTRTLTLTVAATFVLAAFWRGAILEAQVLPAYLPYFLMGGMISRLPRPQTSVPGLILQMAALGILILNLPGLRGVELWGGFYPMLWLDPGRILAVFLVLWVAHARPAIPVLAAPLVGLGKISFCLYLVHRPIMRGAESIFDGLNPGAVFMVSIGAAIGLSLISLRAFERPAARAIRRLTAPGQRPAREAERS